MEAAHDYTRLLQSELDAALARVGTLEAELSAANGRSCAFEADLDAIRGRTHTLEADLAAAITAVERHDVVVTELEMSRARTHTLEAERAEREDVVRQLQLRLDDALEAEARLREQAETKLREAAARASEPGDSEQSEALRWEVERMVSLFDASVRAVNEMASARTSAICCRNWSSGCRCSSPAWRCSRSRTRCSRASSRSASKTPISQSSCCRLRRTRC